MSDAVHLTDAAGVSPAPSPPAAPVEAPRRPSTAPISDPVCPSACGGCHWCLRKKHGPEYWLLGVTGANAALGDPAFIEEVAQAVTRGARGGAKR